MRSRLALGSAALLIGLGPAASAGSATAPLSMSATVPAACTVHATARGVTLRCSRGAPVAALLISAPGSAPATLTLLPPGAAGAAPAAPTVLHL